MVPWRRRIGLTVAAVGLLGTTTMCAGECSTERVPRDPADTTVGEEVFRVLCERVDVGESPTDVDFSRGRPVCLGLPGADATMVGPKVRALAGRRRAVVAGLDR